MSLEKFDKQDDNGDRQNKGLHIRGVATSSKCVFLLPNTKDLQLMNRWALTTNGKSHG